MNGETSVTHCTLSLSGAEADVRLHLPDPGIYDARNAYLWTPEKPVLFDVRASLKRGEEIVDEVISYTALRSVEARPDAFLLNGRPYFLRLVLDQGYWPESHLAAPSGEALKRDVELAKALGFNGVRKHQKIEDPRYLYWADRLGLLVWEELPSAYAFTRRSIKRLTREWLEVIERDASHPCIVAWVCFNESWGVPDLPRNKRQQSLVRALYHLTHSLDASRPVIGNDGWEHVVGDLLTLHDYTLDPELLAARYGSSEAVRRSAAGRTIGRQVLLPNATVDGPALVSEFGGVRFHKGSAGWGYGEVDTADDLLRAYAALVQSLTSGGLSGFCYTQFADTFQEQNGLLYDNRQPKASLVRLARATRGEEVNPEPS